MEAGCQSEELAVVSFVSGEFSVVCGTSLEALFDRDKRAPRTFKHADDAEEELIVKYMFIHAMVVEHNCMKLSVRHASR